MSTESTHDICAALARVIPGRWQQTEEAGPNAAFLDVDSDENTFRIVWIVCPRRDGSDGFEAAYRQYGSRYDGRVNATLYFGTGPTPTTALRAALADYLAPVMGAVEQREREAVIAELGALAVQCDVDADQAQFETWQAMSNLADAIRDRIATLRGMP